MGTKFDDPGSPSRALFERAWQVIPGVPGQVTGEGSLFRLLFTDRPRRSYRDLDPVAEARMERLFLALLDAGVLVHTTGLGCLSTPMGDREVEEIPVAAERALGAVGRG